MTELNDKVAVVTGAGKGIGKAIALSLASEGCNLVLAARTKSDIDTVSSEIQSMGRKALALRTDVSREDDARKLIDAAVKKFGTVDILVNNAGIGYFSPVVEMKPSDFDAMWETNMRGVFLCTQAAIPYMTKQKEGDIINISSLAGRNAFKGGAGYSATKWALIGFSRTLMLEVREHNIRVITICPGSVDTNFAGPSGETKNISTIPRADDIAQVVIDALKMPRNVMVSEIDVRPTNPK